MLYSYVQISTSLSISKPNLYEYSNMTSSILVCLVCLAVLSSILARPHHGGKPQKYAVLVATTKSWLFYRHQSTILHAYHTLLSNGMPKENIITMFYDDIAHNSKNQEPGIIRNHPFGPNLYTKNLTKSYTGDAVNGENFLAVLTGNERVASGPVIKSGPNDTIFVYICGIGAYRAITFPSGAALPADIFVDALKKLRSQKKAKKIFVMLDVAFAASLVHGLVPRHDKIFVNTATHFNEFPSSVYCYVNKRLCYATLYGAAWTQHSDRLRRKKFGNRETLFEQFNAVRTQTVSTHVNIYGEVEMGQSKLKAFLGHKLEKKLASVGNYTTSPSINALRGLVGGWVEDVDVDEETSDDEGEDEDEDEDSTAWLEYFDELDEDLSLMVADTGNGSESLNVMNEVDILPAFANEENEYDVANIITKRKFVADTVRQILREVDVDFDSMEDPSHTLPPEVVRDYEKSVQAFSSICVDINENVYVQQFLVKLAKLCEMRIPLEEQFAAMQSVCSNEHRRMTFAH